MERTVGEVMTREVKTASTEAPVKDVAAMMSDHKISCVVIVAGASPIGIISERDIVGVVARRPNLLVGLTAREVMSSPVETVPETMSLRDVLRRMKERKFRRFPIVDDDGKLIGLITLTDVLHALAN